MHRHFFGQAQLAPRFLLEWARGVCHVETATAITNGKSVFQYVLPKFYGHFGIERLHESILEDIAGNDVRMAGAKNQITIGMHPGPVKGHEPTFIAESIQIVSEPIFVILAAQMAGSCDYVRSAQLEPPGSQQLLNLV